MFFYTNVFQGYIADYNETKLPETYDKFMDMAKHRFPYRPDVLNVIISGKLRLPIPIEHPGPEKVKRLYTGTHRKPVQTLKLVEAICTKPTSNSVVEALRSCRKMKESLPASPAIEKPSVTTRMCMSCSAPFKSDGIHNRLCEMCRKKS